MRRFKFVLALAALIATPGAPSNTLAQGEPILPETFQHDVPLHVDSGLRKPQAGPAAEQVIYSTLIESPGAQWIRLWFDRVVLSGDPGAGNAAYVRITSQRDGAVQRLNAVHLRQWGNSSAYFNGGRVLVEIVAPVGSGACRLTLSRATVGDPPVGVDSICDGIDNRVLSSDPRIARLVTIGCTAWIINDTSGGLLTAGHCNPPAGTVVQFNVPLSTGGGGLVAPGPNDQYAIDFASVQRQAGATSIGNDFAYFGVFPNSNTGLMPLQAQGQCFTLAAAAPAANTLQPIRVTGHGTVSSPVSPTWNQVQTTHAGPYAGLTATASNTIVRYRVDTTGGDSGSPVIEESTGRAIGIHTNAGCSNSPTSSNSGTAIHHPPLQAALANPLSICATGRGTPSGDLYLLSDRANNFGTLDRTTGAFAKVAQIGANWQGLAYCWRIGKFYATDTAGHLFTIDPSSGTTVLLGTLTAALPAMNGLGCDGATDTVYGIAQTTGQLYRIYPGAASAAPIGVALGAGISGMDFDPTRNVLWALDDSSVPTRLIRIDPASGERTVIGPLGVGVSNCRGLAVTADGTLYTIDTGTAGLWRIDPATGLVALVGPTRALLGTSFGLAAIIPAPPAVCRADIATEGNPDPDAGPDGFVTGTDLDLFVQAYFQQYRNAYGTLVADVATAGTGAAQPDGFVTGEDFDSFIQAYFSGCP